MSRQETESTSKQQNASSKERLKENVEESSSHRQEQQQRTKIDVKHQYPYLVDEAGIEKLNEAEGIIKDAIVHHSDQLELTAEQLEQQAADLRQKAKLARLCEERKTQVRMAELDAERQRIAEESRIEAERINQDLQRGLHAIANKARGVADTVASATKTGWDKTVQMAEVIKEKIVGAAADVSGDLECSAHKLEVTAEQMREEAALLKIKEAEMERSHLEVSGRRERVEIHEEKVEK